MNIRLSLLQINLVIATAATLLFVPYLGTVHLFDWDEINFAECAREMLVTNNFLTVTIDFMPFWEKPPLFIWLSAISMKLFGVNEFAARFPNALAGVITLLLIFNIGRRLYDRKMGLLWVLCYAASTFPQFYFKSGIIDPWFNLFIFSGIYFFILFSYRTTENEKGKIKFMLLSALFIGLAMLTKGPVAALIGGLCIGVYMIIKRFKNVISLPKIMLYLAVAATVGGLWFLVLFLTGKAQIITDFFEYQLKLFRTEDAGHGGIFFYHFIVLLFGCFPAAVFTIRSFKNNAADTFLQKHFKLWMLILFWVVLLLFSIVKTKIIHYSSLCYFPLTFLAAYSIYHLLNGNLAWKKWMSYLLLLTGGIVAIALILLPVAALYKQEVIASGIIRDDFFIANLQAPVYWSGWESLIGVLSLCTIICALVMANKQKYRNAVLVLFIGNLIAMHFASVILPGKIEGYTQRTAIDFYKQLRNRDCYLEPYGHKSYAHYFYAEKKQENANANDAIQLLERTSDKPIFIVCRITKEAELNRTLQGLGLKEIDRKNGFIFYMRGALK